MDRGSGIILKDCRWLQDVCVLFAQKLLSKLQDIFIQRISTTVTPEQVAI
jgi:hypothetical protein